MNNRIKIIAGMIMNRVEYKLAADAEPEHNRLDRAVIELAKALRGDAQKPSDNHHPNIHNEE